MAFVKPPVEGTVEDANLAIDSIVVKLNASFGLWVNGLSPVISLPETASPEDVTAKYFSSVSDNAGPYQSHSITLHKFVQIDGVSYGAIHANTNFGQRVVIMRWSAGGWWTKSFVRRGGEWS